MGNVIATNVASINAQRNLYGTNNALGITFQRLSSGFRINSAKDDAAGLQISNKLSSQISGLTIAARNANDGISLSQTAEGALSEATNILQRMRDLSVQSANGSNSGSERAALQQEFSQLQQELNRISDTTRFGGRLLLDGSFGTENFQVGAQAFETIQVSIGNSRSTVLGANIVNANGTGINVTAAAAAAVPANTIAAQNITLTGPVGAQTVALAGGESAAQLAAIINAATGATGVSADARTGANLSGLTTTGLVSLELAGTGGNFVTITANITSTSNLTELANAINGYTGQTGIVATSRGSSIDLMSEFGDDIQIRNFDVGVADDGTGQLTVTSLDYEGTATASTTNLIDAAAGATEATRVVGALRVTSGGPFIMTTSVAGTFLAAATTASTLDSVAAQNISTYIGAQTAIASVDAAINSIDTQRAQLGAVQNRLVSTISNLNSVVENLSASRSRIRDTDFALETANLSKYQVLQQAGLSVLAQANATSQGVLTLLQG